MRVPPASLWIIFFVATVPVLAQSVPPGAPIPPGYEPPPPAVYIPPYSGRSAASRVDPTVLESEAKELLELSQSVQPDIESLKRGLLSKDLLNKLKRIEKLSKHLREQVGFLAK